MYVLASNKREEITTQYAALARTTCQRIYDVMMFRKRMKPIHGEMGAKAVAELYNEKIQLAELTQQDDPVDEKFVQNAAVPPSPAKLVCQRN